MTTYLISESGIWVDIPDARPRVRAKLKKDSEPAELTVDEDGAIEHSKDVLIDMYEGPKYERVRAESEELWAVKDRRKEKKEKVKGRG